MIMLCQDEVNQEERDTLEEMVIATRDLEEAFKKEFEKRVKLRHRGSEKQMGKGPTQYPRLVRADSSDEELYYEKRKKKIPPQIQREFQRRRNMKMAFPHKPSPHFNPLFPVSFTPS
jgi:hypothetical protein